MRQRESMTAAAMNNSRSNRKLRQSSILPIALIAVIAGGGCQPNNAGVDAENPQMDEFVRLMMPRKIEIQHYLTKPFAFEDAPDANGLEVVLSTQDAFGDSVKCVGTFHFELNTRRMASGDKVGDRVAFWSVTVNSDETLVKYWDRLTRSYRFPLQLTEGNLKPGRYVLIARLITPNDTKLYDEYEFTYERP
jgi:hypothetical protein